MYMRSAVRSYEWICCGCDIWNSDLRRLLDASFCTTQRRPRAMWSLPLRSVWLEVTGYSLQPKHLTGNVQPHHTWRSADLKLDKNSPAERFSHGNSWFRACSVVQDFRDKVLSWEVFKGKQQGLGEISSDLGVRVALLPILRGSPRLSQSLLHPCKVMLLTPEPPISKQRQGWLPKTQGHLQWHSDERCFKDFGALLPWNPRSWFLADSCHQHHQDLYKRMYISDKRIGLKFASISKVYAQARLVYLGTVQHSWFLMAFK